MQFRKKWSIDVTYNRQGLIYFICINYNIMPDDVKNKILDLCIRAGGEYRTALFEVITTNKSVTAVSIEHYISPETLYRMLRRFYDLFDTEFLSR